MSIKLIFEIGHFASRRSKPSKEGYTHEWELYVRGPGDADISHFVEKVVFNLHDSFPKPKRAIKEPPYKVKEVGYAGFLLDIDIYLKNRDDPKKVTFSYDMDLMPSKTETNEYIVNNPSDDFRKKCLKGGALIVSSSDHKSRESITNKPMPTSLSSMNDQKKPQKRPEDQFTNLFGSPIKKLDPRAQNSSPNPAKLPTSGKGPEKMQSLLPSSSSNKDKTEKSKHKHSPNKDGKKSTEPSREDTDKGKKDKSKDRDRNDKKDKSKRPPSPPQNLNSRNSTNTISAALSKNDFVKVQPKSSAPPPPSGESSSSKKSNKKDKKSYDKDRDRNDKKEKDSRTKDGLTAKEKLIFDGPASKGALKERDIVKTDDRDKIKTKSAPMEPKMNSDVIAKKSEKHDKDSDRKHKHKKEKKSKDKEPSKDKKDKQSKIVPVPTASPAKVKEPTPVIVKYEPPAPAKSHLSDKDSSDSDIDSPPSIKQDSENSLPDPVVQKPPPEPEKTYKKVREKTKPSGKDDKKRKRKPTAKDERDSSPSPPAAKQLRTELVKSPSTNDRPSSSDSAAQQSQHVNNNNIDTIVVGDKKISTEYMSQLKDLKQKITTLKNNDDLQQVVRLIAATGCYEITKSSFDFDLVQLDRATVQRLQDFFAS